MEVTRQMSRKETYIRIGVRRLVLAAVAALALAGAIPALADANLSKRLRTTFSDCPTNNAELADLAKKYRAGEGGEETICLVGQTSGGKEGGSFTVGGVVTKLNKKITLQGGASFAEGTVSEQNPTGGAEGKIWPAKDGRTLVAPPLAVTKGIKLLTPKIQEEAGWPEALKAIYNDKVAKKETQLSATIEIAGGNLIYENRDGLSTQSLIEAEGAAFTLPLKVKLSGPFLYKLQKGADTCSVGSDEHPVVQHLTSGESVAPFPFESNTVKGAVGELEFYNEFTVIEIKGSTLVDSTWPVVNEAEGCGGGYESYVDKAISIVLSLPAPAGASSTVLKGTLYSGNFVVVKEEQELHGE